MIIDTQSKILTPQQYRKAILEKYSNMNNPAEYINEVAMPGVINPVNMSELDGSGNTAHRVQNTD